MDGAGAGFVSDSEELPPVTDSEEDTPVHIKVVLRVYDSSLIE